MLGLFRHACVFAVLLVSTGCLDGRDSDGSVRDGSAVDGSVDAGGNDAGPDGGLTDGGEDAGGSDAGEDGGAVDGGAADGGVADAGPDGGTDGGANDGGVADAGADGGVVDSGADAGTPDPQIGEVCDPFFERCAGGVCSYFLPGSYCTLPCDDGPCPAGSVCRDRSGLLFCMDACTLDSDCRASEGYICEAGICDFQCNLDPDCAPNEWCNANRCETLVVLKSLGESCATGAECQSGLCLSPIDGGMCTETCAGGCSISGWVCGANNLCMPGQSSTTEELLTGPNPYRFTVGSDVVSIHIVAVGGRTTDELWIEDLTRPGGAIIAGAPDANGLSAPLRLYKVGAVATAELPQNETADLQPSPGPWTFDVNTAAGSSVSSVRVFLKHEAGGPGAVTQASFDLNVFIAAGVVSGLTAASAPADSDLQAALTRFENYWAAHGISLGLVRFYDIGSTYLDLVTEDDVANMLASQTPAGADGALNLVLIRDLLDGYAVGISMGIPGAVGMRGTGGSGVVVALQPEVDVNGDVFAHEFGHFLGLFHVTEMDGSMHDVIGDTPQCTWPPSWGFSDVCDSNLMFPAVSTSTVLGFSTEQGRVMRLNPRGN